ncbi:BACON domain-containing protein [uncultured Alistipes sp.]|uniref:BACON domain-containing protein n=1 Tax=uncultured Alistipes sp. TaxID=538949 RepID=UPI002635F2F0|nr:BACON domain-containing protein [uncultured Alistipes sp.]
MRLSRFLRAPLGLLATVLLVAATACNDKNDNDNKGPEATLEVSADAVTLGAESGVAATVGITTTATWSAAVSGSGFALDPQAGTGNATLRISATEANPDTEARELGSVTITASGADTPRTIRISQLGAEPAPAPDPVTLTLDFTAGPDILTPALPSASADALTGRHEYTFEGYTLAIYADAAANGKFYWNDQAQYYDAPEPNKALYFSKEGAYVEFPAIDGLSLESILYVNSTGAGELPSFDIMTDTGAALNHALDFSDDGMSMTFTLLDDVTATPCRLTILNTKNAQVSQLKLTYAAPER